MSENFASGEVSVAGERANDSEREAWIGDLNCACPTCGKRKWRRMVAKRADAGVESLPKKDGRSVCGAVGW